MTNSNNTEVFVAQKGDYEGLEIHMIDDKKLHGMRAVKVVHPKIAGFEARALVASTLSIGEIFTKFVNDVRLVV